MDRRLSNRRRPSADEMAAEESNRDDDDDDDAGSRPSTVEKSQRLHSAVLAFDDEALEKVLADPASLEVDYRDRAGRSAFVVACQMDNSNAALALLAADCDVEVRYAAADSGPLTGWEWVDAEGHRETDVALRQAAHDGHEVLRLQWLEAHEPMTLEELASQVGNDRQQLEWRENAKIHRTALRARLRRERSGEASRRRNFHSAAPPSTFSRFFHSDGERESVSQMTVSPTARQGAGGRELGPAFRRRDRAVVRPGPRNATAAGRSAGAADQRRRGRGGRGAGRPDPGDDSQWRLSCC